MFLGKVILSLLVLIGSQVVLAAPPKAASKAARPASRTVKRFGVGLGFMMFSENLKGIESGSLDTGIANYSGLVLYGERTWTKNRWIYQAALGVGMGKGTASFSSILVDDLGRRTWTLFYGEGSANYRISPQLSVGAGLIAASRFADWKSQSNTALSVQELNKTIYAPEFIIRWNTSRRITLVQSISTPDFRGSTMWRWTSQFTL